ncbi:MAG TPA: CHAP domain-containing protein [Frankiaceae bacterium]|jgi:surface antigen|nr:CHAP domain-containing protein [Frankiaceae bacterium]
MTAAADVLALARKELGYDEGPNNDNKFAKIAGHANHQPWCASFVVAMFREAGMKLPSESAYTPAMAQGFKKAGCWTNRPSVGAVVFFQWPSMGRIAHVGIVESVRADGSIVTIEGNTNKKGSRTGGSVLRMARRANIAGYGIPAYAGGARPQTGPATAQGGKATPQRGPGSTAPKCPGITKEGMKDSPITRAYQERLKGRGWRIAVDGDHGPGTTKVLKAFQKEFGLTADGVGGQKTWDAICTKPVTR